MDIIWIIFAGLMLYGISKKKPGLMVPFIGLVGFMNVVRTIITKSFYYINYRLSIIVSKLLSLYVFITEIIWQTFDRISDDP